MAEVPQDAARPRGPIATAIDAANAASVDASMAAAGQRVDEPANARINS